ncbi:MAG: hypothetical protein JXL80_08835 [Planctomycetes bacterium]|nr:hypothetical protein [Planctomycetota bacterium]
MKKLVRLLVAVVVVLAVAVGLAWYFVDSLAKKGIEKGATYALQVQTTVDKVSLSLLNGSMTMDGLTVANPEGYETAHLIKSGRFDLQVDPGTLLSKTVHVTKFTLDGLDMNIEQKGLGKSNVSQIMENLKRFESPDAKPKDSEPSGKKVAVDEIVIENVVAHVQLLPIGGKASTVKVEVPKIVLNDVTSDNAQGVAISELTARLLPAILNAVLEKGGDIIPGDLAGTLRADVAGAVQSLGSGAAGLLKQSGGDLGKNLEEAKKNIEEAKKDIGGKLKGILGGQEKPQE